MLANRFMAPLQFCPLTKNNELPTCLQDSPHACRKWRKRYDGTIVVLFPFSIRDHSKFDQSKSSSNSSVYSTQVIDRHQKNLWLEADEWWTLCWLIIQLSKDLDEIQICRNTVIYELPYIIYLQYKRLHAPKWATKAMGYTPAPSLKK